MPGGAFAPLIRIRLEEPNTRCQKPVAWCDRQVPCRLNLKAHYFFTKQADGARERDEARESHYGGSMPCRACCSRQCCGLLVLHKLLPRAQRATACWR